jgi:iporin
MTSCSYHHINCSSVRKSSSMPNLKAILQAQQQQLQQQQQQQHQYQLNVSEVASTSNESSMECRGIEGDKPKAGMLPMFPIPITTSDSNSHNQNDNSTSNNEKVANPPSFNLVKLFIKQKSSSSDTCMDVSSGCWPSDSTNSSTEHPGTSANGNGSNSSLNRLRKKSMNDSGKCSALSKHEEDAEYQLDSLDAHVNDRKTNDFNREIFDSPTHRRNYKDCALNIRKNPLLMNVLNSSRQSQSESSRTSENLTQIFKHEETPTAQMTVPIDMITKSIQTSMFLPSQTETSHLPQNNVKMVPPSFLSQLSKLGSEKQAPVYVIYPNYALPDLGFINKQSIKIQKDVIMSPMGYQVQPKMAQTFSYQQQRKNQVPTRRRPQSLDVEKLQQNQYEHVQDWKSLLTLLPRDYKKLLKNVPEVNRLSMEASMNSQKPMFCMSPPIRRGAGMTCDCHLMANQTINSSSSGGSSQPPSSGYRGSSTMLTDSEMDVLIHGGSAQKLFGEISTEQPRPPPGRKGILRRTNTTTNTPSRVTPAAQKSKRYSMMDQPKSPMQQQKTMTVGEKRRSLQEPNFYDSGLEDYFNNIGGTKNFANRLPNYMKTRDGDSNEKDLNQLMTELELNKALSNKLNYDQQSDDIVDIESKLRAESLLNGIPKSEWKHYAEIASLLELNEESEDRANLRNEVSKVLSSRKVSFNHPSTQRTPLKNNNNLQAPQQFDKKFSTPPNSPQMSQFVNNSASKESDKKRLEKEKQEKIQSNRFKRLQIQWELLSKDAEERAIVETKSGGTTPTGHNKVQSKIPRPVSYPNSRFVSLIQFVLIKILMNFLLNRTPEQQQIQIGKPLRSPSRMQTPKKYTTTPTNQTITSPTTGIPRTPNKLHTTPKKTPVR